MMFTDNTYCYFAELEEKVRLYEQSSQRELEEASADACAQRKRAEKAEMLLMRWLARAQSTPDVIQRCEELVEDTKQLLA